MLQAGGGIGELALPELAVRSHGFHILQDFESDPRLLVLECTAHRALLEFPSLLHFRPKLVKRKSSASFPPRPLGWSNRALKRPFLE